MENLKECPGKDVEMVWACEAKRGALCRNWEGDGNGSSREEEERKV